MKRRLLPIAAVAIVVVLLFELVAHGITSRLDPAIEWYSPAVHERYALITSAEWQAAPPHTIFVGSSQIGRGVDVDLYTGLTGHTAANMGLPNAGPHTVRRWLFEEVLPRSAPEVVVIGISSFEFNINFESRAGPRYDDQVATRPGTAGALGRFAHSRSALYAYRQVLSNPIKLARELRTERLTYRFDTPMFGWPSEVLDQAGRDEQLAGFSDTVVGDYEFDQRLLAEFDELVSLLLAQGIQPVIVFMPVVPEFIEAHTNAAADFEFARRQVLDVAQRRDVHFIDLASAFPASAFYDNIHLTVDGAADFTQRVAQHVQRMD